MRAGPDDDDDDDDPPSSSSSPTSAFNLHHQFSVIRSHNSPRALNKHV